MRLLADAFRFAFTFVEDFAYLGAGNISPFEHRIVDEH
jgi:hypothetical protein